MSSRRVANSRRSFLKTLPTAIAAGAAAAATPVAANAQAALPAPDAVTADAFGTAQQLIGVSLPPVERESARPLVAHALDRRCGPGARPAAAIYAILNAEAGAMFDDLVRTGAINELADKGPNGRANQLRASRFIPAVEYIRAQRVRTILLQQMNALFERVDVFLAPAQSDSVTMTNLTGHPAVVLPAGLVEGLPVGLMLTGTLWDEATILRAAGAFESATEWHTLHPHVWAGGRVGGKWVWWQVLLSPLLNPPPSLPTCFPSDAPAYLPYLPPTCLLSFRRTCLPSPYLPAYLPARLPTLLL